MTDHAAEVRNALTDPVKLCASLGLTKNAQRQARGLLICCPAHGERNPSCSVTPGPDGTIRVRCFACDFAGDALRLIATVEGLDERTDFREVLALGAELAGHMSLASEIRDGRATPDRKRVPAPSPAPERGYPERRDVSDLWARGMSPADDREASGYLAFRRIDPVLVASRLLARVIVAPLPAWARFGGRSWLDTGHRLMVRTFDADGSLRGVRAIRVRDGDSPKRLPPAGHKAAGLAMANRAAHEVLRGGTCGRVVIVEGEPDFLSWATQTEEPVLGVLNGSWSDGFAAAIPRGARVVIRTHSDEMGDKYAQTIAESLAGKCELRRVEPEAA